MSTTSTPTFTTVPSSGRSLVRGYCGLSTFRCQRWRSSICRRGVTRSVFGDNPPAFLDPSTLFPTTSEVAKLLISELNLPKQPLRIFLTTAAFSPWNWHSRCCIYASVGCKHFINSPSSQSERSKKTLLKLEEHIFNVPLEKQLWMRCKKIIFWTPCAQSWKWESKTGFWRCSFRMPHGEKAKV